MNLFIILPFYLLLKISSLGAEPHPDCVPPALLAACKQAKCVGNQLQNCETRVSAYPGGNQCCNQYTLKELKKDEDDSRFGTGFSTGFNTGSTGGARGPFGNTGGFGTDVDKNIPDKGHGGYGTGFSNGGPNGEYGSGFSNGRRKKRQAYNFEINRSSKWTSPITLYINFANSGSYIDNIRNAVAHIEDKTCLKFVFSTTPPTTDHIAFNFHTEGCASFVGKSMTTASPIVGNEACYSNPGNMINLLAQTLGLWHQTQRPDRDLYLYFIQSNMIESHKADFKKVNKAFISTNGVPYDHASITQLPALAYSSKGWPTIIPRNREMLLAMGQRVELSYEDAKKLNELHCSDKCTEVITCNNGGYQDPSNCASCVCPEGFGGVNCTMGVTAKSVLTTNDCGGVLEATMTPAYLTSPGYDQGNYPENIECQWIIKGTGGKLSLRFVEDFQVYADEMTACQNWVEVKYKNPLHALGTRLCGSKAPRSVIYSHGSDVVVVFKSNNVGKAIPSQKGFKLSYTLVDFKPCNTSPCKNEGECLSIESDYKCRCPDNFAGRNCEIDLRATPNQCNFNPCRNNGTCEQVDSLSYTCTCLTGFSGDRCEKSTCGGCGYHYGYRQKQCTLKSNPPKNCTTSRFETRYSWRFENGRWEWRSRREQINETKECVKEFCCEDSVKIADRCGILGWTSWTSCTKICGGGEKTRYNYGLKNGYYSRVDYIRMKCNEQKCGPCSTYRDYYGNCV